MQRDLDLETAKIANQKHGYDIERLKRKSIQDNNNTKRQPIPGEHYRSNKITPKKIKAVVALIAAAVVIIAGKKMHDSEIKDTYSRALERTAEDELTYSESVDFLENYDVPKEHYDNYIEALENINDAEYTFFGNRKDGTHNDTFPIDPDSTFQLSDKQKDAIDIAVTEELEEYQRGR